MWSNLEGTWHECPRTKYNLCISSGKCTLYTAQTAYGRFPDSHFPGKSFPGNIILDEKKEKNIVIKIA